MRRRLGPAMVSFRGRVKMNPSVRMRGTAVAVIGLAIVTLALPSAGLAGSAATDGTRRLAVFDRKPSPKDAQFYNDQWNLKAIRAKAGWPAERANPATLVAIVDTGIDYLHPDLAGRVDLVKSKSYLDEVSRGLCQPGEPGTPYRPSATVVDEDAAAIALGRHPVTDFHSHGTGVSALIASNAQFLAGVTQRTTLFGVKVHGVRRTNCLSVYLAGIRYAADAGADVIHLSIPLEFDQNLFPGAVGRIEDTLAYAHAQGAVLVAAAGNAPAGSPPTDIGQGNMFRFCKPAVVFCVSATGPASAEQVEEPYWDEIAAYSNFGSPIDVAGPGGTGPALTPIVGVPLVCSRVTQPTPQPKASDVCQGGETLTWESTGTSFGAAVTSGLAALLVGILGKDRPGEIEGVIERSAVDLGTPGWDKYYGHGRIDVKRAVREALP
jgi:subtilisin family serine protease